MALEQHAILSESAVPSPQAWQEKIDERGFHLQLDPELKPFEDSGFLPCQLNGKPSGFEINYGNMEELLSDYPQLEDQVTDKQTVISFRWGGDMAEGACVMIASLALAELADAIIYYPDGDIYYDKARQLAEIKDLLNKL